MPVRQIDFPDAFYKKMVEQKQDAGQTFRRQVLVALARSWGWGLDSLPKDGRLSWGWEPAGEEAKIPSFPQTGDDDGWGKKEEF